MSNFQQEIETAERLVPTKVAQVQIPGTPMLLLYEGFCSAHKEAGGLPISYEQFRTAHLAMGQRIESITIGKGRILEYAPDIQMSDAFRARLRPEHHDFNQVPLDELTLAAPLIEGQDEEQRKAA